MALLKNASSERLYGKLVAQLNKDFRLSGISIQVPQTLEPIQLVHFLRENLYRLLLEDFPKFLNLLYIVDVTEKQLRESSGGDAVEIADTATFLLLKRIWKKVWFKENYE